MVKKIKKKCEYCNDEFERPDSINGRGRRFCSRKCMYDWRKNNNWITTKCMHCGKEFRHRKKEDKKFCSLDCFQVSDYKKELARKQLTENNPMLYQKNIDKIKQTKLKRYGDINYNNKAKSKKTIIKKYGVSPAFWAASNGVKISKPQQKVFEQTKKDFPGAILEEYLKDVGLNVDIYIPSQKRIIEVYGDYWHCNPEKYNDDYYHKQLHMTAKEKWIADKKRQQKLEDAGYRVEVVWENTIA